MVELIKKACVVFMCLLFFATYKLHAEDKDSLNPSLKVLVKIPTTSVKNQGQSGTCWSFATTSFLETELLRTEQIMYDFSEMFVVRKVYIEKARKYLRLQGNINFSGGGEANDVLNIYDQYGFKPQCFYPGKASEKKYHNHKALDSELYNYIDSILYHFNEESAENWEEGFNNILDTYLGPMPKTKNKHAHTTAEELVPQDAINTDDYVLLTSFTHHPYYFPFILELPDNWSWGEYYNLPLAEFKQVVDSALYKNYSVVWAADYSEEGFLFKNGIAVAPSVVYKHELNKDERQFLKQEQDVKVKAYASFNTPIEEIKVNADNRQLAFDNQTTTDDHLMHIVGISADASGKQYYYVKNSWGTGNLYDGYFYVTEPYFLYKSISIMVHKNAIPQSISSKIVW